MSAPIVTITLNPALDITTTTTEIAPTRKLRCDIPRIDAGGGGVNVSRAIAEFGGQSRAFVMLGGPTGKRFEALMAEAGLDARIWSSAGDTRFSLTVNERLTGAHYRFVMPGPVQPEDAAEILIAAICEEIGPDTRFVVGSGSLPPGLPDNSYARIARHCRELGIRFILDASGPALAAGLAGAPYLIKLNHHEARELIGGPDIEETSAIDLGRVLHAGHGVEVVVISLGSEGAVVIADEGAAHIRPPRVKVASTVGAGDSFVGAIVFALHVGWPLAEACRYGVAAAAAAVMTPATELCRKTETDQNLTLVAPIAWN